MILPWILDDAEERVEREIDDLVLEGGSRESGGCIGDGIMEGIELMSLIVPAIRYLSPRDPIPRSEFLYHDHVC